MRALRARTQTPRRAACRLRHGIVSCLFGMRQAAHQAVQDSGNRDADGVRQGAFQEQDDREDRMHGGQRSVGERVAIEHG